MDEHRLLYLAQAGIKLGVIDAESGIQQLVLEVCLSVLQATEPMSSTSQLHRRALLMTLKCS